MRKLLLHHKKILILCLITNHDDSNRDHVRLAVSTRQPEE